MTKLQKVEEDRFPVVLEQGPGAAFLWSRAKTKRLQGMSGRTNFS